MPELNSSGSSLWSSLSCDCRIYCGVIQCVFSHWGLMWRFYSFLTVAARQHLLERKIRGSVLKEVGFANSPSRVTGNQLNWVLTVESEGTCGWSGCFGQNREVNVCPAASWNSLTSNSFLEANKKKEPEEEAGVLDGLPTWSPAFQDEDSTTREITKGKSFAERPPVSVRSHCLVGARRVYHRAVLSLSAVIHGNFLQQQF